MVIVKLADAGVKFLVHGHQVPLVCNIWNGNNDLIDCATTGT